MSGAPTVLLLGATGATGRLLTEVLLARGCRVRAVVRDPARFPRSLREHERLAVTTARVQALDAEHWRELVAGVEAVASCLGHPMDLRGVFGPPYRLVTDAVRGACAAIRSTAPSRPVRLVLMNTAGNRVRGERVSRAERVVVTLVRALVPPHADNEAAARWLQRNVPAGDASVEWAVVRPDTLVDAHAASPADAVPAPTRSAIFDPGRTSRINVAHFMADLVTDDGTWQRWRGSMPVLYNHEPALD